MKVLFMYFITLFLVNSSYRVAANAFPFADSIQVLNKPKLTKRILISEYGFLLGGGTDFTSFKALNTALTASGHIPVDNILIARTLSIWTKVNFVLQAKYTRSDFYNSQHKDSQHTSFNTTRFETTIGASFIKAEK